MTRTPLVAGNWKMHLRASEAEALAADVVRGVQDLAGVDVAVCPPFPYLERVGRVVRGSAVALGAQDGHWEREGAYTGWVSMPMLVDVGCTYVIIGHSERRQHARETDEEISWKVRAGLREGLRVILCVGETEAQRDAGVTQATVVGQLERALLGLAREALGGLVIAYEPVWAIGTGRTATPPVAQEVHALIREWLAHRFGSDLAERTRVLYGGSVKPENMAALASMPDIDGALVGGASLRAASFVEIARQAAAKG